MESTPQALRRVALFEHLPDDELTRIVGVVNVRTYDPGETIIFEGDLCEAAYFIANGHVRVYRLSPNGREQDLARLGSGQSFNTVPPFQIQGANHATVEALTPVSVHVLPADEFRQVVGECPELALALLRDFAERLDHLTGLVEDLALRTVRQRMARFLLRHVGESGEARRWTQDEIAAHLGTVRDVVGRTLRAFADAGLMRMDRERIVLLDRGGLEDEAGH
jgi:CRP/FNR family transcriptional regulator